MIDDIFDCGGLFLQEGITTNESYMIGDAESTLETDGEDGTKQ